MALDDDAVVEEAGVVDAELLVEDDDGFEDELEDGDDELDDGELDDGELDDVVVAGLEVEDDGLLAEAELVLAGCDEDDAGDVVDDALDGAGVVDAVVPDEVVPDEAVPDEAVPDEAVPGVIGSARSVGGADVAPSAGAEGSTGGIGSASPSGVNAATADGSPTVYEKELLPSAGAVSSWMTFAVERSGRLTVQFTGYDVVNMT